MKANWLVRKGQSLKFSHEYLDPGDDLNEGRQVRNDLAWGYTPMQFSQARTGPRCSDGVPQVDVQNPVIACADIHDFFLPVKTIDILHYWGILPHLWVPI